MIKKSLFAAIAGISMLAASVPAMAQGIGHSFFMRGSIVDTGSTGTVVCIGKADGAEIGQKLDVYRVVTHPGPSKGVAPTYHRQLIGHVTIDHIFDDHFAHVTITDGTPAKHDLVELRKN